MTSVSTGRVKEESLRESRTLNPRPEAVVDEVFRSSAFCDPRDLVQVKYEMVRRVRVDGVPVGRAAAAFGFCRQSFYAVAAALDSGGPAGLVPGKPGPKGPRKLTEPVMAYVESLLSADPELKAPALAAAVREEFELVVHPRSIERRLARRRESRSREEDQPGR